MKAQCTFSLDPLPRLFGWTGDGAVVDTDVDIAPLLKSIFDMPGDGALAMAYCASPDLADRLGFDPPVMGGATSMLISALIWALLVLIIGRIVMDIRRHGSRA